MKKRMLFAIATVLLLCGPAPPLFAHEPPAGGVATTLRAA